ncbi:NAD(P)-binding protein [Pleurostoma richardsiae]|uniref:NAD(P)-binding protein n=1 Tax=Pleurostoma richardsiae TaxID=41990 RepID=A0AA38RFT8_9PEZI|nr:NAD(P)-binding protein [Pleurostoma richardsiae]
MPLEFLANVVYSGPPSWMPDPWQIAKVGGTVGALAATKWYCGGATNTSERNMHGRVVMITGGTSGIGASTAFELARRGAQIILLTRLPPSDPFLVEYIDDLRDRTDNHLIYAEQVDLASLYSIRQFATKWIDNAPPRRLDMIILCASTLTPPGKPRTETPEGVDTTFMVNYLANFHLLGILSPALRAQPFDRDVRVIFTTCPSYISSTPLPADAADTALGKEGWSPGQAFARSKLALMVFGQAFQQHLDVYKRPDELPMNARVVFVDPGYSRTPGMRRWLTRGSLWGLLVYLFMYWFAWLFLKSPHMGAQSVLYAAMDGIIAQDHGGKLIKECMEVDYARRDIKDEEVAKKLWESTDKLIEKVEKRAAQRRAREKREQEEAEKAAEVESLVDTIKKGKEAQKAKAKSKGKGKGKGKDRGGKPRQAGERAAP